MGKFKKILKNLVFPITLLTVITLLSLIISIYALYIAFSNDHTAAIYAAISIPITGGLIFFYLIDRWLIKRVSYLKLMLGEITIGILIFLMFLYQDSYTDVSFHTDNDSYTDINFHTDQDYILVIFNSEENSLPKFNRKGLFGKELNVYNTNKIHLDRSMSLQKDLRIKEPKEWMGSYVTQGKYYFEGDSIDYFYSFKMDYENQRANFIRQSEVYIDSLLKREIR